MEPIVDLSGYDDVDPEGDFRLVCVGHEKGGESFDIVTVYDRAEWLDGEGADEVWRNIAQQSYLDREVVGGEDEALVQVELPGWWVDSEQEDADPGDHTWKRHYGEVFGTEPTLAVVDAEWSRDRAAWSFPKILSKDGRWKGPGRFGLGGPKSLLPVVFGVGVPTKVDAEKVQRREAREAADENPDAGRYDWEAAIEAAEKRVKVREKGRDAELDISAIESMKDQGTAVYNTAMGSFRAFMQEYEDRHGVSADAHTMSAASDAIAQAVRECKDLDDPRDGA